MSKVCPLRKLEAIKMLQAGKSKAFICKEVNIDYFTLDVWNLKYQSGGEAALLKEPNEERLPYEEKLKIIDLLANNVLSLREVAAQYNINKRTINRWRHSFQLHGPEGLINKKITSNMSKKRIRTQKELDELELLRKRNEYLEAENALLKKVKALVEEREARLREIGQKPSKN